MEVVVPWQALINLNEPHSPKASKNGGRPPYPLATMLSVHLLQQWYSLSDPAMEEDLIEVPTMRRFAGITAANVHDLTPAAELLHGEEKVVYTDAGFQGNAKRPEMAGRTTVFRVAMRPGKRLVLPDTPEGRLADLVETAKVHIRSKAEHPFRVIKQQFGFQKSRLRGLAKNR